MKKITGILISIALTCFINNSPAQTSQGGFIISGATSFSIGTRTDKRIQDGDPVGNDPKTSSIIFNPTAGYFVMDNLAVGLTIIEEYSNEKYETDNGIEFSDKNNLILFGPIGRYYYGTSSLRPFGQASLLLGTRKNVNKADNFSTEDKEKSFGFGLGVGGAYFINQTISVDATMGYSYLKFTNSDDSDQRHKTSAFNLTFGFSVFF